MTNQPNRPRDLDMSDVHADARNMLEDELLDLDLPMIDIAVILLTVGDHLDIDPIPLIQGIMNADASGVHPLLDDIATSAGKGAMNLMRDLVFEAIESTTQLPHIARALEIYAALNS